MTLTLAIFYKDKSFKQYMDRHSMGFPGFPFHLIIFDYNRSSIETSWPIIFDDRL